MLSCSLLDIGRSDEPRFEHHYAKWWIYLTHWGLMACAIQAWLGAWIVTQGMMVDRDDFGIHFFGINLRSKIFKFSFLNQEIKGKSERVGSIGPIGFYIRLQQFIRL